MIVRGPFQKLELADEGGLQPNALGHLRLGEPLTPSSAPRLWKIGKRTVVDLESLELPEQLRTGYGGEAVARSRRIDQLAVVVLPEHQRVDRSRPACVAADDELLPSVHAHLHPRA